MNPSESEERPSEPLESRDERDRSTPAARADSVPGKTGSVVTVIVALAAGLIAMGLASRVRLAETVLRDRRRGEGVFGEFAELSVAHAIQNGIRGYAILGAILAVGLGMTAVVLFHGRHSMARACLTGLAGGALGAVAGAASSFWLIPVYFRGLETADLTFCVLIHMGIWTTLGMAAGAAYGIGSGSPVVLLRSLIGGIIGAALATLVFDIAGAFFPLAHTEKPLPDEAGARLVATLLLCSCVAAGIVAVAAQRPRVVVNKP